MKKVGLFAYGENGFSALKSLLCYYHVLWIVVPPLGAIEQDSSKVEALAKKKFINIIRTNSNNEIYNLVSQETPDAVVISSYNKILETKILKLTKFINIHHGDLPRWRGRANINWAIITGRSEVGLTFHQAITDLDAGNIYAQYVVPISKEDTIKTMYDKFNNIIESELADIVLKVIDGNKGKKQNGIGSYCCTRLPEDGLIDWQKSSEQIHNLVRALTKPYPGAFTYFEEKKIVIWEVKIPESPKKYEGRIPGRIIAIHKNFGVEVLTGDSSIIITKINDEGKDINASEIIRSVKGTLGINWVELYEKIQQLEI